LGTALSAALQMTTGTDRLSLGRLGWPRLRRAPLLSSLEQEVLENRPLVELSDEQLVLRCQNDDHDAFTVLVNRYKDRIHWLVRRMVGGPDDEDLTQEVFIKVYRALPGFRGGSSFKTWIFRIAHNHCLSDLRNKARRGEHLSIEEEGDEKIHCLLPDTRSDLEREIEKRDLSQSIRTLMERLPPQYREVLTLFYIEQARYEEIAEIMGIPLGTVKTHIHRARLRLRDLLLAEGDIAGLTGGLAEDSAGGGGEAR
jgi:RNA polymerase sigma-70 factor (ECF subfamily)